MWGARYAFGREAQLREGLFTATRGRARFLAERDVLETDVRGSTIAFATYSASERVQVDVTGIFVHRVRARGRGRSCLVDRGDQGGEEGTALNSPVLDGGHVYWHDFTANPGIVERVARAPLPSACRRRPGSSSSTGRCPSASTRSRSTAGPSTTPRATTWTRPACTWRTRPRRASPGG